MDITMGKPEKMRDWIQIQRLYREAFPGAERKPFSIIRRMYRQGRADVWCFFRAGKYVGFAATVNGNGLILLDYLAVSRKYRGMGVGSEALVLLMREYAAQGVFVEIESTRSCGVEQLRRKRFYLSAGMKELGVNARVFGVEMELLGIRCALDFESYRDFYRNHYSRWAAEHLEVSKL